MTLGMKTSIQLSQSSQNSLLSWAIFFRLSLELQQPRCVRFGRLVNVRDRLGWKRFALLGDLASEHRIEHFFTAGIGAGRWSRFETTPEATFIEFPCDFRFSRTKPIEAGTCQGRFLPSKTEPCHQPIPKRRQSNRNPADEHI